MTLTDFLLARIAEDEQTARSNTGKRGLTDEGWYPDYPTYVDDDTKAADEFIHRFTATRVLAECEAKRKIVEHAQESARRAKVGPAPGDGAWFLALRYIALPYVDHPDYRDEWRP